MRFVPWFLILLLLGSTAVIARHGLALIGDGSLAERTPGVAHSLSTDWISDVQRYSDEDYDFSMAVPAGWQPIVTVGADEFDDIYGESGYAVGFEAPRDSASDSFADYVLVEILPGTRSGRFTTDGSQARSVRIGGLPGIRESLAIDGHDMGAGALDLMVHQAEVGGMGFTIGFYAIGEPSRRALLDDAFELMIRTFDLHRPPFRIS